jgi:hydrogenase maturation protease
VSRALVIGCGSTLRSDDGVGWHAATALATDPRLAARADVLAVHQLTPELALDMSRATLVVLVDAAAGGPPGEIAVRRLLPELDDEARAGSGSSSHHAGPAELLALARELYGSAPPAVIVSIAAASLDVGEDLSPEVQAALPAAVESVVAIVLGTGPEDRPAG